MWMENDRCPGSVFQFLHLRFESSCFHPCAATMGPWDKRSTPENGRPSGLSTGKISACHTIVASKHHLLAGVNTYTGPINICWFERGAFSFGKPTISGQVATKYMNCTFLWMLFEGARFCISSISELCALRSDETRYSWRCLRRDDFLVVESFLSPFLSKVHFKWEFSYALPTNSKNPGHLSHHYSERQ